MAASHPVAGENIEDGNDEEADAGGNENGVEHKSPLIGGFSAAGRMVQMR
jgi:hypothetical protein